MDVITFLLPEDRMPTARRGAVDYTAGKLQNDDYPAEEIAMALAGLPSIG